MEYCVKEVHASKGGDNSSQLFLGGKLYILEHAEKKKLLEQKI